MTKDECISESNKYFSRTDFHNKARKYYDYAKKNNILEEISFEKDELDKKLINEHKNQIQALALDYDNRSDFKHDYPQYYSWVVNHHFQNEIFSHMKPIGNAYKRCIYSYEFSDGYCYVGLTYNLKHRNRGHHNDLKSAVLKHAIKNSLEIPNPKQLTEYVDVNIAILLEEYYYQKYKKEGWFMLNVAKRGAIGSFRKESQYDIEYCKQLALQYKTKREFELSHKYLYNKINLHHWNQDVFSHMDPDYSKSEKSRKISEKKKNKKMNIKDHENFRQSHSKNPILQLDADNQVIQEFYSINKAAEVVSGTSSGIKYAALNGRVYKNYKWKFKNEYIPKQYNYKSQIRGGNKKAVSCFDLDGKFINTFPSCLDAAISLGHKSSAYRISLCCKGIINNCIGYKWSYAN